MAAMCKWGDIKFSVSSEKALTFKDFSRKASGRWAIHSIVGKKPKTEYQGADLDEVTMEVTVSTEMGVNPRTAINEFYNACKKGTAAYLYVGGKKVCANKMSITAVEETWDQILNGGELVKATTSVTFTEYR